MTFEQLREQYENQSLPFDKYYMKATELRTNGVPLDEAAIRGILEVWLSSYANSVPTTKGGKVGRFFARIGAAVVSVVKFEFFNKKKK